MIFSEWMAPHIDYSSLTKRRRLLHHEIVEINVHEQSKYIYTLKKLLDHTIACLIMTIIIRYDLVSKGISFNRKIIGTVRLR